MFTRCQEQLGGGVWGRDAVDDPAWHWGSGGRLALFLCKQNICFSMITDVFWLLRPINNLVCGMIFGALHDNTIGLNGPCVLLNTMANSILGIIKLT